MYYCTIDVLTPNPKHSSIYGLLYAEVLEHLFLPATLIMTLTVFPAIFMLVFLFLIYYFYGHLLGEIKTSKDVIKICTLMVLVLAISFYPDIAFFVNVETGVGYIFMIGTIVTTTILYSAYHLKKMFVDAELNSFLKFYGVVIVSSIASSIVLNIVRWNLLPLIVKCKECGSIVKWIDDPVLFAEFDPWSLEGEKCKVCGHVFHDKTAEYKITPLFKQKPSIKQHNKETKIYTINHKFWSIMTRRRRCRYCGGEFKIGDKIVSVGAGGKRAKRYHLECYKRYQEQEIIVTPFSKVGE